MEDRRRRSGSSGASEHSAPSPPRKQQRKRDAAAPAASSTARGGRQFRFGQSLKPLEKLPYESTEKESADISAAEVREFFAKKPPPPKEKIDPVKAKRTTDALKRPPPPPSDDNHVRCLKKTLRDARDSGTTSTDKRLAEQRSGKKFPSSANRRTNRAPLSRCLAISSQFCWGWCPVPILVSTCWAMHILIHWRWTNSDTSTGSHSSKMEVLL